jgi:hypothetical protein
MHRHMHRPPLHPHPHPPCSLDWLKRLSVEFELANQRAPLEEYKGSGYGSYY